MAWLAVLAMLLLVAAPTISRVVAATVPGAGPILTEMCTAAGLKVVEVLPFAGGERPPAQPGTAVDDACGYCLLATPLPLVLVVLFVLLLRPAQALAPVSCTPFQRSQRNLRGLGSQAPPLPL